MEIVDDVCDVCKGGDGILVLICDGLVEGSKCNRKICFECAGVSHAPSGEFICADCTARGSTAAASASTGGPTRRLRAQSSHPDAPSKKAPAVESPAKDPVNAKLDEILSQMVTRNDLHNLHGQIRDETRKYVQEQTGPLQNRMDTLEGQLGRIEVQLSGQGVPAQATSDDPLRRKVLELESQLAELSASKSPVAVAGGFNELGGLEEARAWIEQKCAALSVPAPIECYTKGDFTGLVFLKFRGTDDRDRAALSLRTGKFKIGANQVWIRNEAPVNVRAIEKFLFGLKKQLVTWGYGTKEVRVDLEGPTKTLSLNSSIVATASVNASKILIDWCPEWLGWQELQTSPELRTLIQQSNDMLDRAAGGKGKGAAKGNK